jgi:hypothetical protein
MTDTGARERMVEAKIALVRFSWSCEMSYEKKGRVNNRLEKDLRPARFARRFRPLSLIR